MQDPRKIEKVSGTVLGTFEIFQMLDIDVRNEIAGKLQMYQAVSYTHLTLPTKA